MVFYAILEIFASWRLERSGREVYLVLRQGRMSEVGEGFDNGLAVGAVGDSEPLGGGR